ncbi:hypothetical protein A33Q_3680 [Indibacter alkaliphilus LW1]|uniref:Uncharacterized protein n=1 Tax=Indibacter alkaliphilus (strain CCUG 57479 / KCTC 22604 / LW1) TaxID=1189612 RepID=S2D483_INDAL|nr:hypothetical protein A33Q_3680 [Indibacter alkaliphilus LW1]
MERTSWKEYSCFYGYIHTIHNRLIHPSYFSFLPFKHPHPRPLSLNGEGSSPKIQAVFQ